MSMTMHIILQMAGILVAYLGVTLLLPCILLHKRMEGLRLSVRFMAYFMTGNFYLINLVLALQLLHISYRATLILGTLLPFLVAVFLKYRGSFPAILERWTNQVRLVLEKELGIKTILLRLGKRIRWLSSGILGEWMASRWVDLLLTGGVIALVFYLYGMNGVKEYGYCASDIVVHNYWINEMGDNHVFAAGVYPYGFHCVIYYLHTVFAIPTYVLLRLFFVAQTLMLHLMLLAFLKGVCKSKYAPYAGILAYMTSGVLNKLAYIRFFVSLPQEFGMLFILPTIYFVIAFLQGKLAGKDAKVTGFGKAAGGKKAGFYLIYFAIGISLTLSGHFYDTMITALLCMGVAVGFAFRCFQWQYLKRILVAGVTGILLAVLPMGIAYATGTPLEGSLYWGMSVISGAGEEDSAEDNAEAPAQDDEGTEEKSAGDHILWEVQRYVATGSAAGAWFFFASTGIVMLLGLLWFALRKSEYGAVLLSIGIFVAVMLLLQAAEKLGMPQLLEKNRCPIYSVYGMAASWSLCVDAVLWLAFREKKGIHIGSLVAVAAVGGVVLLTGIRKPLQVEAMETNGAIVCLENIIHEDSSGTWTICSANDERQMAEDYGYHYEIIDFLRQMEGDERETIHIPTKTVYFFIEKEPLLYTGIIGPQKTGKMVSEEEARKPLPGGAGSAAYGDDARLVTMSRMYYWAKEFARLYPNEMEVYYESDEFVCYRVRQNEYSLYDFAIDYGYN